MALTSAAVNNYSNIRIQFIGTHLLTQKSTFRGTGVVELV